MGRLAIEKGSRMAEQAMQEASRLSTDCAAFQGMSSVLQGVEGQSRNLFEQLYLLNTDVTARLTHLPTEATQMPATGELGDSSPLTSPVANIPDNSADVLRQDLKPNASVVASVPPSQQNTATAAMQALPAVRAVPAAAAVE